MTTDIVKFVYFSELIGVPVLDSPSNTVVGRVADLAATTGQVFPRITGVMVRKRGRRDCFTTFSEAPQFYTLFTVIILIGVIVILIPGAPLIAITIWTQVLNAILLPVVLICMMIIINKTEIMEEYTN